MNSPAPSTSPSSEIPAASDNTIAEANAAAQSPIVVSNDEKPLTPEQKQVIQKYARGLLHSMNKHNTPFDARKENKRKAKARASRKANKKRKLYVRYGKQT